MGLEKLLHIDFAAVERLNWRRARWSRGARRVERSIDAWGIADICDRSEARVVIRRPNGKLLLIRRIHHRSSVEVHAAKRHALLVPGTSPPPLQPPPPCLTAAA